MIGPVPWWHRAAIYQIYPRSFRDLNGDGTGDLPGVISELPYVAALGVDAIWLSPFYPSPQHDSGYDVVDPRGVDPMYGTLDDVRELIEQAHARSIRVIVDVVPNHSSSDRAWFQEALSSPPGSDARARYHFVDGRGPAGDDPPNNWTSWFGGRAWTRVIESDGSPGQWYLHTFDSSQPDLNWSNAEVRADGLETLRFWLDSGADGFRVDVALGLMKDLTYPDLDDPEGLTLAMRMDLDDGTEESMARRRQVANSPVLDRDEVQDVYREWRAVMNSYEGDRMAVAEAWVPPERAARYVAPDTLHQIFNFDFMAVPWDISRVHGVIEKTMTSLAIVNAPPTWALSNHDTPRVVTRLGGGSLGLRRARAMALIAHALPGAVYVYQGEELGLADAPLPDSARQDPVFFRTAGQQLGRDAARVPIPWAGSAPPYGFSDVAAETWLPQPEGWANLTVANQTTDPGSPLQQYVAMLRLRHAHPGLLDQGVCRMDQSGAGALVLERGAGLHCVVNFSEEPLASPIAGRVLVSSDPSVMVEGGRIILPPSTGAWIQA
jgi:alpha-glucosidase